MSTTGWIIVAIVIVVVVAVAAWLATQQRRKQQHQHAEHLRQEAHQQAGEIPEAQLRAREAEAEAERARVEAERAQQQAREAKVEATQQEAAHEDRLRTADEVDPRVDTSSEDYRPGTTTDPTADGASEPRRADEPGGTPGSRPDPV